MSAFANASSKRILIVDDSRAIQAIIRRTLECEELGSLLFQTAHDGAEALDKVQSFKPDLVLSDWHMPGVSGIEMLQTLRQTGHDDIAVGFITTDTAAECRTQARSNGALFVLNKPFDDRTLRSAVALGLGRSSFGPSPARTTASASAPGESSAKARPGPNTETQAIESLALTQQALFAHLGMRGFDLTRSEGRGRFIEDTPQLIALYGSHGRRGAYAIGLLDLSACCLIGGLAAGCSPQEIKTSRDQGKPSAKQIEQASRFMRAVAPLLKKRSPSDTPSLNAARLSSQPPDKLVGLIEANSGRSDFNLRLNSMGAHGDARLSFMLT
ncbi:response regulator [Roseateles oligotrophus]|uniref:Response regulator n=1 Tax=Roseateles oligotrophus TaxID=1769250 RepID=A0ABT2YB81_9BURK|nr:response regulator [Roseateles oligotrophus]MCV2367558.1 response regulator [Roseateles oligotrophus]